MTLHPDLELFQLVKKDDVASFNLLFKKYWERLYVFVHKKLQSEDDAKDIVQNVFISVWMKRNQIDIQQSFESYLFSVARYQLLSFIAQAIKTRQKQELLFQTILPGFEELLSPKQAQQLDLLMHQEVEKLPNRMRQIVKMTLEQNLSIRDISLQLHLSEQSVRNQLNIAISKVKTGLGEAVLMAIFIGQF